MLIGAHLSISGGVDTAFKRAEDINCTALQIFTKSNRQWKAKPFATDEVERYHQRQAETGLPVTCHASYLINIGSPKEETWQKSVDALEIELDRCEQLRIPHLVLHPGSRLKSSLAEGIAQVAKGLDEVHRRLPDHQVKVALEVMAGQGSNLGAAFEEIARIIEQTEQAERLAVCFDTCHVFAAGYDIRTEQGYERTISEFDQTIGLDRLAVIHVNDSVHEFGSRKDRHAHIGEGHIGLEPFGFFLNDPRFKETPFLLETPKENDPDDDVRNLAALRGLLSSTK